MDYGVVGSGSSDGSLAPLVVQAVAWLVVVAGCAIAVRRPWAWTGLAGGLLGLAHAGTYLADALKVRSDNVDPVATYPAFGPPETDPALVEIDWPGFIQDADLHGFLDWVLAVAVGLVAVSFVTGALLSRRRATPAD